MNLKFSAHKSKHLSETWNQITIKRAMEDGRMKGKQAIPGATADVVYGYVDGECIGLIISKTRGDGSRIIITGFAAPESYWQNV